MVKTNLPDSTQGALANNAFETPYSGALTTRANGYSSGQIKRTYLVVTAVFRTQNGDYRANYVLGRADLAFQQQVIASGEINQELLAFSTKNDNQKDIPTMTLRLSALHNWDSILTPNDYVELSVSAWGDDYKNSGTPVQTQVLMTGLISEINMAFDASSNTKSYIISCQGLAKILSNLTLTTFPEIVANGGYLFQDASEGLTEDEKDSDKEDKDSDD